jgi:excinuclease UvrABC ATPase subunit
MSLGECLSWFKNHPKCRALAQLVERVGIGGLPLTSKLEDYSYETAFLIALVRELRKLREEVTIYIPSSIWSETGRVLSSILKETIEAQLHFYRAKIIVLEHE